MRAYCKIGKKHYTGPSTITKGWVTIAGFTFAFGNPAVGVHLGPYHRPNRTHGRVIGHKARVMAKPFTRCGYTRFSYTTYG